MKRLLLLLPLLMVTGCGYGSMAEAEAACGKWANKGGFIKKASSIDGEPWKSVFRSCKNEAVTRQILGYEIPGAQAGTTYIAANGDIEFGIYTIENGHRLGRAVITKRFKY